MIYKILLVLNRIKSILQHNFSKLSKGFIWDTSAFLLALYGLLGQLLLFNAYSYYLNDVAPIAGNSNLFVSLPNIYNTSNMDSSNNTYSYINMKSAVISGFLIFASIYFFYSNFKKSHIKGLEFLFKIMKIDSKDLDSRSDMAFSIIISIVIVFNLLIVFIYHQNIYPNISIYILILSLILGFSAKADYYFNLRKEEPITIHFQKQFELEHNSLLETVKLMFQVLIPLLVFVFLYATYYWIQSVKEQNIGDAVIMKALTYDFEKIIYLFAGIWIGFINPYYKHMSFLRGKITELQEKKINKH